MSDRETEAFLPTDEELEQEQMARERAEYEARLFREVEATTGVPAYAAQAWSR